MFVVPFLPWLAIVSFILLILTLSSCVTQLVRVQRLNLQLNRPTSWFLLVSLGLQLLQIVQLLDHDLGFNLGLIPMCLLVAWSAVFWTLLSHEKLSKDKVNSLLLLALITMNGLVIFVFIFFGEGKAVIVSAYSVAVHALMSIIAYTVYVVLAIHAAMTLTQNYFLQRRRYHWLHVVLPSLEAAEKLMHRLIGFSFMWLSLALLSGVYVLDDWFIQQVSHKTVFTSLAWLITAWLIYMHKQLLVDTLARAIMVSFVFLLLGVVGSKFVLEFLLHSPH